jgi:hypothetical protein
MLIIPPQHRCLLPVVASCCFFFLSFLFLETDYGGTYLQAAVASKLAILAGGQLDLVISQELLAWLFQKVRRKKGSLPGPAGSRTERDRPPSSSIR